MSITFTLVLVAVAVVVALLLARRAGGSGSSSEDPEKLATLLVTEIRLYNEDLVAKGRREKAIYDRLRDEIERARAMHEERLGKDAARHFDLVDPDRLQRPGFR